MAATALSATTGWAQKLPPPSRQVFKCEQNGAVVYSDQPCLGARRIDVEPTRGLDSSSGRSRRGADVRREERDEATATALKPLFNETAPQRAKRHRRSGLAPASQRLCERLDAQLPQLERAEATTPGAPRQQIQADLYHARQQYRSAGC